VKRKPYFSVKFIGFPWSCEVMQSYMISLHFMSVTYNNLMGCSFLPSSISATTPHIADLCSCFPSVIQHRVAQVNSSTKRHGTQVTLFIAPDD